MMSFKLYFPLQLSVFKISKPAMICDIKPALKSSWMAVQDQVIALGFMLCALTKASKPPAITF